MTVFERNNSYLFYATKTNPPKPVYFEMNGYDTLLVSYYDKYTIHYHSFEKWDYDPDDDPDVLEIPHCKYNSFCAWGGGGRGNQRRHGALRSVLEQEMGAWGRGRGSGGFYRTRR